MKLAESCVIEQHIDKILQGTPDAAALIVRSVSGRANNMAAAPKERQDGDVILPIDLEIAYGRAFQSMCWEAACLPTACGSECGSVGTM